MRLPGGDTLTLLIHKIGHGDKLNLGICRSIYLFLLGLCPLTLEGEPPPSNVAPLEVMAWNASY